MSTSSAFWALFLQFSYLLYKRETLLLGLQKFTAAACTQCTTQRQQKAANTSLLESKNLLQTATLVFPRPIVCSRLSNNINILAKKLPGRQRGGGHGPRPRAGSAIGYKRKSVEVGVFRRGCANFGGKGRRPPTIVDVRVAEWFLSCGIKISAVHNLDLSQSTRVTDGQTDGRMDRQNYDSQDRPRICSRGKKRYLSPNIG